MDLLDIAAQTLLAVVAVIVLARMNGLRSFSKMSSFDFALTIAAGSVLATMMTSAKTPWPGLVALTTLFAARFVISLLRQKWRPVAWMTDNMPLMLFYEGQLFEENLALARVTRDEVRAKLREANAISPGCVRAVVLEATGDVSVLHGDTLDPSLLDGVSWGRAKAPE
ncbi:MAG TPA: YetF domain-containing protein [Roseovarius sp.]